MITSRNHAITAALFVAVCSALPVRASGAQRLLPRSRADMLLDAGLWPQAEEAYYAQSRVRPRDPVPRAALGRYLAMKGAVLPGTILIEEAMKFGLDSATGRTLLRPWRAVLSWRSIASLEGDSTIIVRASEDSTALFQLALPRLSRTSDRRPAIGLGRYRDTIWADVMPRIMGADSLYAKQPRVGIELLEAFLPAYDTEAQTVTLHADWRSATRAKGVRFPVLRDARGISVLMTSGRTLTLAAALRELGPTWWQLDLPHGVLVVR